MSNYSLVPFHSITWLMKQHNLHSGLNFITPTKRKNQLILIPFYYYSHYYSATAIKRTLRDNKTLSYVFGLLKVVSCTKMIKLPWYTISSYLKAKHEFLLLARDLPKAVQAAYHLIPYFIFCPQEGKSS